MSEYNKYRRWGAVFFALFFIFSIGACGKSKKSQIEPYVAVPDDEMTKSALSFLGRGLYGEADRDFNWALRNNPRDARANIGRALSQGHLGNMDEAFKFLKTGCKYAKENDDRLFCHEATIRLHTLAKRDKDWFQKARQAFTTGNKIDPRASGLYFYMAIACQENMNFDEAENLFQEVIDKNSGYVREAQRYLEQLDGIFDAMPVTRAGRDIVKKTRISRADCAALIVEEMKLGVMLKAQTALKAKDRKQGEKTKIFSAKDIKDHQFAPYIENALALNLDGLQVYGDGMFRPDEYLNRGVFAIIVADMLIRMAPERVSFPAETPLPFTDVQINSPFYEAVMFVTLAGIMDAKDKTKREFAPLATLSGAEALLALKKLKEK